MPELPAEAIYNKVKVFAAGLKKIWSAVRKKDPFVAKYKDWLQEEPWPAQKQCADKVTPVQPGGTLAQPVAWRKKHFVELILSAKKKRTKILVITHSPDIFRRPLAAEITGVDIDLIIRFSVILKALSYLYNVQPDVFKVYALETARLFVTKYPWFYMPASVHKILIHGADVMKSLVLPIGQLSEEALESRHKDCRYYKEHNTRKIGRKQTIEDLLHALLISSDPLISSIRPLPKQKTPEVLQLLKAPEPSAMLLQSSEEEIDSE